MSNNHNQKTAIANAIKLVREEIVKLGDKIRVTPEGPERDKLNADMTSLMDQIGMVYEAPAYQAPDDQPDNGGQGFAILKGFEGLSPVADRVAHARERLNAEHATKPSLWNRTKACYANNRKKFWAAFAIIIGAAAGTAYYVLKIKDSATVSSVSRMAVADAVDAAPEAGEATVSIFARIGAWVVEAASATKDFIVAGYTKLATWVKGLFNKSTTESSNDVPETAPVAA